MPFFCLLDIHFLASLTYPELNISLMKHNGHLVNSPSLKEETYSNDSLKKKNRFIIPCLIIFTILVLLAVAFIATYAFLNNEIPGFNSNHNKEKGLSDDDNKNIALFDFHLVQSKPPSSQPSSSKPSIRPSRFSSINPTTIYSSTPSKTPSLKPSAKPTISLTSTPSSQHSTMPSLTSTNAPNITPSTHPSRGLSSIPSIMPTFFPIAIPSFSPSTYPSNQYSNIPSLSPSHSPTNYPTTNPSDTPSKLPTAIPTSRPSFKPSISPTFLPSISPTSNPSSQPSFIPTMLSSMQPSISLIPTLSSNPSSQPSTTHISTFFVTGDRFSKDLLPQRPAFSSGLEVFNAIAKLPLALQALEGEDADFLVHLGDSNDPDETMCLREAYTFFSQLLIDYSPIPVLATIGQRDTEECPDRDSALQYWKDAFINIEQNWPSSPMTVKRMENQETQFSFMSRDVLFLGLDLVTKKIDEAALKSRDYVQDEDSAQSIHGLALEWVEEQVLLNFFGFKALVIFANRNNIENDDAKIFLNMLVDRILKHLEIPTLYVYGKNRMWQANLKYKHEFINVLEARTGGYPFTKVQVDPTLEFPFIFG